MKVWSRDREEGGSGAIYGQDVGIPCFSNLITSERRPRISPQRRGTRLGLKLRKQRRIRAFYGICRRSTSSRYHRLHQGPSWPIIIHAARREEADGRCQRPHNQDANQRGGIQTVPMSSTSDCSPPAAYRLHRPSGAPKKVSGWVRKFAAPEARRRRGDVAKRIPGAGRADKPWAAGAPPRNTGGQKPATAPPSAPPRGPDIGGTRRARGR